MIIDPNKSKEQYERLVKVITKDDLLKWRGLLIDKLPPPGTNEIIYVDYIRRSSDDKQKQVESIPSQLEWCTKKKREKDMKVVEVFIDKGTSTKPGRYDFGEMMDLIYKLNDAGYKVGCCSWKVNRLGRNPIDEGTIKYAFMEGKIKHILCSDREFKEGDNQILMGIEFSSATQTSIDLSKDVIRGMDRKVTKQWRPTYAPLGYLNDKYALKGEKIIHCDPERFDKIKAAWKTLLSQEGTVPEIVDQLNKDGFRTRKGRPLSASTMYSIFNNLFYTGFFEWNGEVKDGGHKPMITMEEYDRVQIFLGRKGRPRVNKHEHAYTGLIRCAECGCMVTAEPPKTKTNKSDGKIHMYRYMRCTKKRKDVKCGQKYIQVEDLEKQINEILKSIEIPESFKQWIFKELRRQTKEETKQFISKRTQLQKLFNENETMAETLVQKLLKGVISDEVYKEQKKKFVAEQKRLNQQINSYNEDKFDWLTRVERVFNFASYAREEFEKGDIKTKRQIFSTLGSNFLLNDKKLYLELEKPFFSIKNGIMETGKTIKRLEPLKKDLDKVKPGILDKVIPVWSG